MALSRVGRAARNAAFLIGIGGLAAGGMYLRDIRPRETRKVEALEAKRLFHFGRDAVASATLHTRGATLSFERDGSEFVVTAPVNWPARSDAAYALLDRVAGVSLDTVLTESASTDELSKWGLDRPIAVARLTLDNGEERVLRVGPKNPLVDKYPVTDGAGARVGLADPAFIWALDRPPEDFRANHLLPNAQPKDVTTVEVRSGAGGGFRLVRGPKAWTVAIDGEETPPRMAAASRVRLFLVAFTKRVEILRFVSDDADPPAPDAVIAHFRFTLEDGSRHGVGILRSTETSAEDGAWQAHLDGTRTRVEIDPSAELELRKGPSYFFERTLSRLDPAAVTRVEIQLGRKPPQTLVRTALEPAPAWALRGAPETQLKSWRIDALIRLFAVFEAQSIHEETPSRSQLREWLIEPPSRRFVFFDAADAVLAEVRIGHRFDETHLFARSDRSPRVGLVPEEKLSVLPGSFDELVILAQ